MGAGMEVIGSGTLFIGDTIPTGPSVHVGSWWLNTADSKVYKCTSIGPPPVFENASSSFRSRFRVYFDGSQVIPRLALTKVTFNHVDFDDNSEWDAANNRFVVKEAGSYSIVGGLLLPNFTGFAFLQIVKNNAAPKVQYGKQSPQTCYLHVNTLVLLSANDYIDMRVLHMSTGSITVSGGTDNTFFSAHRIG